MIKVITINITSSYIRIPTVCEKYREYDIIGITEGGFEEENIRWIKTLPALNQFTVYHETAKNSKRNADSIALLVNKRWKSNRIHTNIERSISIALHTREQETIKTHLIYGPHTEKDIYWNKWIEHLGDTTKQKIIVMGDLNIAMNHRVDRASGRRATGDEEGGKLLNQTNLKDVWREDNIGRMKYTYHAEGKDKSSHSRIDYILLSQKLFKRRIINQSKIEKVNYETSGDHSAVTTELEVKADLDIKDQSTPTQHIERKINVKKLKELETQYKEAVAKEMKDYEEQRSIEDRLDTIDRIIKEQGEKIGGLKEQRRIAQERENEALRKKKMYLNRLNNALNSHAEQGRKTKAIRKTELNPPEYKAREEYENDTTKWRHQTVKSRDKVQKEVRDIVKEQKQRAFNKAKERLLQRHITDPKGFFNKIKGKEKTIQIDRARDTDGSRTGNAVKVKEIVRKKFEALFQKKGIRTEEKTWLNTKTMERIRKGINKNDNTAEKITREEVLETLTKLEKVKDRATSNNIPLELYTLAKETLAEPLAKIFDEILQRGDIPENWKEGKIYMIYKPGREASPEEVYDYRPITLLPAAYKIYTHIINARIRKIHEPWFSTNQGGFRESKACQHKLMVLRSLFEDAKEHKKEIHALYIDIKKAYDNIAAEEVAITMEAFGYNKTITKAIKALGEGIFSRAITAHGLTDKITLQCGLRQGCPLSPLLFIIFLEPLILQLNEQKIGYKLQGRELKDISNLEYADDAVLITGSHEDMQKALDIVREFFNCYELELSIKDKEKTVYTHNNPNKEKCILNYVDFRGKTITIPHLKEDEAYPYLGTWITLNLNWEKQELMIRSTLYNYLNKLNKKALSTEQKILVINTLIIPHIAYRMGIARFDTKVLRLWDRAISAMINKSMGTNNWLSGRKDLQLPKNALGLGLESIEDTQAIALVSCIIDFGINSSDPLARLAVTARMNSKDDKNGIKGDLLSMLKKAKLEIVKVDKNTPSDSMKPWIRNFLWERLKEVKKTSMSDFYRGNTFVTWVKFRNEIPKNIKFDKLWFDEIRKILNNSTMKNIATTLKKGGNEIAEEELYYSEETNLHYVWTDGSFKKGTAGSGIYSKEDSKINGGIRTPGWQSNYQAELYAIWMALKMVKEEVNLRIITDSESAINAIDNKRRKIDKYLRKKIASPLVLQIQNMKDNRTGTTEITHCYSHIRDLQRKDRTEEEEQELNSKLEKMREKFDKETDIIIDGNDRADDEAFNGRVLEEPNRSHITQKSATIGLQTENGIITAGIRRVIKTQLIRQNIERANEKGELYRNAKGKWNRVFFEETNPKQSKLRIFYFKLVHNKLHTPVKMKQRNFGKGNDIKCTFGCEENETIEHVLSCPKNPKYADEEEITQVLRKIDETGYWNNRQRWYHHEKRPYELQHDEEINEQMEEINKNEGDRGIIPAFVRSWIIGKAKQKKKEKPEKEIGELQEAILRRAQKMWNTRCKVYHEKRRQQRKEEKEKEKQSKTRNQAKRRKIEGDTTEEESKGQKRMRAFNRRKMNKRKQAKTNEDEQIITNRVVEKEEEQRRKTDEREERKKKKTKESNSESERVSTASSVMRKPRKRMRRTKARKKKRKEVA